MTDALYNFRMVLWAVPEVLTLVVCLLVLFTILANRRS